MCNSLTICTTSINTITASLVNNTNKWNANEMFIQKMFQSKYACFYEILLVVALVYLCKSKISFESIYANLKLKLFTEN